MKYLPIALLLSAASALAQVQAFIPGLTPARRVPAVYPESARQQNLQGNLQFLVTVDASGKVTNAEALTGSVELRQAALDAVKQWTFRPVIRDGKAVSAMTTAMLEVAPPHIPGTPRPAPVIRNMEESMAASRRILLLEKQFPRSPGQVLADLEQQAADTGLQRFYALAKLAKAAVQAGSMSKAKAYATELLQTAPQHSTDWNHGNAIHDGNEVLGIVALREGNVAGAKQYLLEASKTRGSPQLNSFGPNMSLAKELIDANEREAVVQYFESCRAFWKMGSAKLDNWTAMVRGGGKPDFGANLAY